MLRPANAEKKSKVDIDTSETPPDELFAIFEAFFKLFFLPISC